MSGDRALSPSPQIVRVISAGSLNTLGPGARNRFVVHPDAFEAQSPIVLMVEDFITGHHEFDMHPHRGFETVTFYLDGAMEHADHLDTRGVLRSGDVQWMTAGRGILHGGRPLDGEGVHALQLWLNLPAALKMSAPSTREQKLGHAASLNAPGIRVLVYGDGTPDPDGG